MKLAIFSFILFSLILSFIFGFYFGWLQGLKDLCEYKLREISNNHES